MRLFMVVSEEYETCHATEIDPPEFGADVWTGEAANRAEAKRLAWRAWTKQRSSMLQDNISDGRHPMAGTRVIEWLPCETHQSATCEECTFTEAQIGKRKSWVWHATREGR